VLVDVPGRPSEATLKRSYSVAGKLNTEEVEDMLSNMRLAAPAADGVLVQLLTRWASAGRQAPSQMQMQAAQSCCLESAGEPQPPSAHEGRLHSGRLRD
jgi:hypothetical protein